MSKETVLFIGTIKKVANCGESMKNHVMLRRFREVFDRVLVFDTWGVKHKPWRSIKLLWYLLFYRQAKIVVSASTYISYDVFRLLKMLGKKNVYYWVIGGVFPQLIEKNNYNPSIYRNLKGIFVESPRMVRDLEKYDIHHAYYVPNIKRIDYQPSIEKRDYSKVRFVFLSRIHPAKGCDLIIESAKWLNDNGYQDRFIVDFYGAINKDYTGFESSIENIDNVNYKGFLKLSEKSGYDTLATYSMMLFPTFWSGEGFPGIIIDAFTAGLPVLASDWNFNHDLVDESTGIIISHHNQQQLTDAMKRVLDGVVDIKALAYNSLRMATKYDDRNVLSESLFKHYGLLE